MKPGLSVCIICRDEEKNIIPCLDFCYSFADEIIVNDTGSKDKTTRIIEHAIEKNLYQMIELKLIKSEWQDDFSIARNQAAAAASYEWIMWVDADDRVRASIEDIEALKHIKQDRLFSVLVKDGEGGGGWYQDRIYPNLPGLQFSGRVHEALYPAAKAMGYKSARVDPEGIVITHTGYMDKAVSMAKQARNLKLLQMELEEGKENALLWSHIGNAHYVGGEYLKALEAYIKADSLQPATINHDLYERLPVMMGVCSGNLNRYDDAENYARMAFGRNPKNVEAMLIQAGVEEMRREYTRAGWLYSMILETETKPNTMPIDYQAIKAKARERLAYLSRGK